MAEDTIKTVVGLKEAYFALVRPMAAAGDALLGACQEADVWMASGHAGELAQSRCGED